MEKQVTSLADGCLRFQGTSMTCNVPIPSPTARSCCLPNQTNIQSSLNMEQKRQCHLKTAFDSPWIEQYPDQASNTVTTAADISTSWMTDFFTTHIDRQRNSVSCVENNFGWVVFFFSSLCYRYRKFVTSSPPIRCKSQTHSHFATRVFQQTEQFAV